MFPHRDGSLAIDEGSMMRILLSRLQIFSGFHSLLACDWEFVQTGERGNVYHIPFWIFLRGQRQFVY